MPRSLAIAVLAAGGLAAAPAGWCAETPDIARGRARGRRSSAYRCLVGATRKRANAHRGRNAGLRAPLRSHPAGGSLLNAPVRPYENHCVVCHTAKAHRRVPPLPLHTDDLRYIVTLWASQQGLTWSRSEIEDVVHYLDRTHYRFDR